MHAVEVQAGVIRKPKVIVEARQLRTICAGLALEQVLQLDPQRVAWPHSYCWADQPPIKSASPLRNSRRAGVLDDAQVELDEQVPGRAAGEDRRLVQRRVGLVCPDVGRHGDSSENII